MEMTEKKLKMVGFHFDGDFFTWACSATYIFDRHSQPVQVVNASPCGRFIATGGEDDRGFVVDTTNGELVIAFFGHKGIPPQTWIP